MELTHSAIEMEYSGIKSEQTFGIADMGMLFEILRHKMYSRNIAAICREVGCNARDAHREAGKADSPIEITLPNNFDPHYRVRDYGPGIDPERMSKVFILYAASTKRNDNMQTGGFGLGAKTPFSYSNRFNIITVTGGMKRTYTAVIDESRVGKLLLNAEVPTTEPNGTEIVVPVERKDFEEFRTCTHEATRHWSVKPVIHGAIIDYRNSDSQIVMSGDNWYVLQAKSGYYGGRQIKILVDEIEYPFDISVLNADKYSSMFNGNYQIFLKFGVGILSLAASREQLDADERTRFAIEDALEAISSALMTSAQQSVDKATSFREANIAYRQLTASLGSSDLVKKLKWNGKSLFGDEISIKGGHIEEFVLCVNPTDGAYAHSNGRRGYNRQTRQLRLAPGYQLIINDVADLKLTDKHATAVAKALYDANNPDKVQTLQIAKFADFAEAKTDYELELVGYRLLSEFVKPRKVSARSYLGRMTFYKFSNGRFGRSSIVEYEADTNVKVCVTLYKSTHNELEKVCRDKNDRAIDSAQFSRLRAAFGGDVSFYGFMHDVDAKRLADSVTDIKTLESYIDEYMVANGLNVTEMREVAEFTQTQTDILPNSHVSHRSLAERKGEITRADSPLLAYLSRLDGLKELCKKYEQYMSVGHFMGFQGHSGGNETIAQERAKVVERYPLLESLQGWNLNFDAVIEYINLIDTVR